MESSVILKEISFSAYEEVYLKYGGSFPTHPKVLDLIGRLSQKSPIIYYGVFCDGEIVGAIPTVGQYILATADALKLLEIFDVIDMGHCELILPVAADVRVALPFQAKNISDLNWANIGNLRKDEASDCALAKGIAVGSALLSAKNVKNRDYETRRLQASGGVFVPVKSLSVKEFIQEYHRLFLKRRGFAPKGADHFDVVLGALWDLLCGDILLLNDAPVAMEILYKTVGQTHISVNYVNSAVDMAYDRFSPGSVLLFRNVGVCEEEALRAGKNLRFCMGTSLAAYKAPWSYRAPWFVLAGLSGNDGVSV